MARFQAVARKIIEAEQFTDPLSPPRGVFHDLESGVRNVVKTLQGQLVPVALGEWIVQESNGPGHYPIQDEEFRRTYEPISEGGLA